MPMASGTINSQPFTQEDLVTRGICILFGGECGEVCPHRFIRHRWNISLCPVSTLECCLGPAPDGEAAATYSTTTSTTVVSSTAPEYDVCGVLPSSSDTRKKRIVGGHTASHGSWPWLVALRNMLGSVTCSGAVIAQRWVVTAAHCFKYASNPNLWRVRVGEHDLFTNEDNERDLRIHRIIVHPQYSSQAPEAGQNHTIYSRYVNDIALIHLAEDTRIEPICLPTVQISNEDAELSNVIRTPDQLDGAADYSDNPRFGPTARRSLNLATGNEIPEGGTVLETGRRARQTGGNCWVAGWGVTLGW
ncbi:Transmembrane protease serine 12 [Bulinus truncatus]|nr:Transmembrane protease serine 12 [Bulinus truncatus]